MCEESMNWGLLGSIPNDNTLIIRCTGHELIVLGNDAGPDPTFMTNKSSFAIASTDFP